jgi:competence protein ComEA
MNESESSSRRRKPFLRRAEQAFAGSLLLVSLLTIGICWYVQQHRGSGLIDLEQPHDHNPIEFQIDLNTAEPAELRLLPGVGETLAKRIISSRDEDGPFRSTDELRRVRGIGPRTLERIEPYLLPIAPDADVADR